MNILFVDDDIDIIEAFMAAVDFNSIGIDQVFSATNVSRAKEILETETVDLMVTDIEMPNSTGIDLLKWVREKGMSLVTMFCTCYADFNYAQMAIKLKSFDYFLKPIAYDDFTKRLKLAVDEANLIKSQTTYEDFDIDVKGVKESIQNDFWKDVLTKEEKFSNISKRHPGANYNSNEKYIISLAYLSEAGPFINDWKSSAYKNLENELISKSTNIIKEASFNLSEKSICSVFRYSEQPIESELFEVWKKINDYCRSYLELDTNFYYVKDCCDKNIKSCFSDLISAFLNEVSRKKTITLANNYFADSTEYSLPQLSQWESLFTTSDTDNLIKDIFSHLDSLTASGKIDSQYLNALQIDITQMVHTVLKHFQVNAHTLYSNTTYDAHKSWASYSVSKCKEFTKYLIETASNALTLQKENTSGISLIKAYINEHLSEELSRGTLAEIVYLNPDYMARLFKKQVGVSIGSYILQQRIKKAKSLLRQTNKTINEIAHLAGYNNFSYFSQIFHKKVGLTPNEYRNNVDKY